MACHASAFVVWVAFTALLVPLACAAEADKADRRLIGGPRIENEAKAGAVGVGILPSTAAFTKTNGFSATGAARASALVGAVGAASSSKTEIKGRRLNSFPSIENEAKAGAVGVGILPSTAAFTKTNGFSATGAARASALVGAVGAASSSKTEIKG